jgi:hypothetical protein
MANILDSAYGKNVWIAGGYKFHPAQKSSPHVPEKPILFTSTDASFSNPTKIEDTGFPLSTDHHKSANDINRITAIASGSDKFVALYAYGALAQPQTQIIYSSDGLSWNVSQSEDLVDATTYTHLVDIKYGSNNWVAVGTEIGTASPTLYRSDDITITNNCWTKITPPVPPFATTPIVDKINCIIYENTAFYAFSIGCFLTSFDDGTTWIYNSFPNGSYNNFDILSAAYDTENDVLVICGKDTVTEDDLYATRIDNVWDNAPNNTLATTEFNSVVFTGNHFYMGSPAGKLYIADISVKGAATPAPALVWSLDTTVGNGDITSLSYAKNTLLIGLKAAPNLDDNDKIKVDDQGKQIVNLDGGVANKLDVGDREITLGGNLTTEGKFSTVGCDIIIQAFSEHAHDDNHKKVTLHGDLEISNKNIKLHSNNDNHKITIESDTTLDQNLSQSSSVTFQNVILASGAQGGSGSVASKDYVDSLNDFLARYNQYDGSTPATGADRLDVLLTALGIIGTNQILGGGGSASASKPANCVIRIALAKLDSGKYGKDSTKFMTRDGTFHNMSSPSHLFDIEDATTELALTDINGEFELPEAVVVALADTSKRPTDWAYYVLVEPILDDSLGIRDTYAATTITQPSFDFNSGAKIDKRLETVLDGEWDNDTSINIATTIISDLYSGQILSVKTVGAAQQAVADALDLQKNDLIKRNVYKELDASDTITKVIKSDEIIDKLDQLNTITELYSKAIDKPKLTIEEKETLRKTISYNLGITVGGSSFIETDKIKKKKVFKTAFYTGIADNCAANGVKFKSSATATTVKQFTHDAIAATRSVKNVVILDADTQSLNDMAVKASELITKRAQVKAALTSVDFVVANHTSATSVPKKTGTDMTDVLDEEQVISQNRGAKLIEEAIKDEETDIAPREFTYKVNPIKWVSESVNYGTASVSGGANNSSVEILVKTNKGSADKVHFEIVDNPSKITFDVVPTIDKTNKSFKITANPDPGNHTVLITATENNLTIRKKINIIIDQPVAKVGSSDVNFTFSSPSTSANNITLQEEQFDSDDDEDDVMTLEIDETPAAGGTEDRVDLSKVDIEVEDPDGQTSNDFKIVTSNFTGGKKGFKIRGKAFKFGFYRFSFKIKSNHAARNVYRRTRNIYFRKKIYENTLNFAGGGDNAFYDKLEKETNYNLVYNSGRYKTIIELSTQNDNLTQFEFTNDLLDDLTHNDFYKSVLRHNFKASYHSDGKIKLIGNKLVNNLEIQYPDFEIDTDFIYGLKNVDTIVGSIDLPSAYIDKTKYTWNINNNKIKLLNENFEELDTTTNNIGNKAYIQINSGQNSENFKITISYVDTTKALNNTTSYQGQINLKDAKDINIHYNQKTGDIYLYTNKTDITSFQFKMSGGIDGNFTKSWKGLLGLSDNFKWQMIQRGQAIVGYAEPRGSDPPQPLPSGKWIKLIDGANYLNTNGNTYPHNFVKEEIISVGFSGQYNLFSNGVTNYPVDFDNGFNKKSFHQPISPKDGILRIKYGEEFSITMTDNGTRTGYIDPVVTSWWENTGAFPTAWTVTRGGVDGYGGYHITDFGWFNGSHPSTINKYQAFITENNTDDDGPRIIAIERWYKGKSGYSNHTGEDLYIYVLNVPGNDATEVGNFIKNIKITDGANTYQANSVLIVPPLLTRPDKAGEETEGDVTAAEGMTNAKIISFDDTFGEVYLKNDQKNSHKTKEGVGQFLPYLQNLKRPVSAGTNASVSGRNSWDDTENNSSVRINGDRDPEENFWGKIAAFKFTKNNDLDSLIGQQGSRDLYDMSEKKSKTFKMTIYN